MTEAPQDHVHDYDEDGDCRVCGRDLFDGSDGEVAATPDATVTAPTPGQADEPWRAAWMAFLDASGFDPRLYVEGDDLDPQWVAAWKATAQAAITAGAPAELAAAMAETRALTGHLDLATRLMLDLGGDQLAASARRIRKAAGLES